MSYVLVEDGEIVSTTLPEVGELLDGRQVSGFNKLPPEDLAELGWLPVEDPGPPNHDPETQFVDSSLQVVDGTVVRVWVVETRPPEPEPVPALEDRISALEQELADIKTRTSAAVVTNADAAKLKAAVVGPPG